MMRLTLGEALFGRKLSAREYLRLVGANWFGIPDIEPWLKTCPACGDEFIVVPGGFRSKYAKRCFPCRLENRRAKAHVATHLSTLRISRSLVSRSLQAI